MMNRKTRNWANVGLALCLIVVAGGGVSLYRIMAGIGGGIVCFALGLLVLLAFTKEPAKRLTIGLIASIPIAIIMHIGGLAPR